MYEKRVRLSPHALAVYLRHAYGDVDWLDTASFLSENSGGVQEMHVLVVRSAARRMGALSFSSRRRCGGIKEFTISSCGVTCT